MAKGRLGEILVARRLISAEQLKHALEVQQMRPEPLGEILVSLGYLKPELVLNVLAAQLGVWPWRLEENPPRPEALKHLPAQICRNYRMLPVEVRGDLLMLAMTDPLDVDAIDLARNATGLRIEPVLADTERLLKAIDQHHGARKSNEALDSFVDAAMKDVKEKDGKRGGNTTLTEKETRPVVSMVNQLLTDAIRLGASDVHIEPRENRVDVRFRVDGQMQKVREVPQDLLPMLTARLKIMAELDIVEYRVPQDGRVSVTIDGRSVDLRVSVLPNVHGQRIVLRILDKSVSLKKLNEIGFSDRNLKVFRSLVSKPYGMFLVTGPTGSGKTTTLYAALGELRGVTNNVMTCEDPVEYDIDGVNQSMVNEKVGLTFARQLRAILRQDPDVILVGEIRDGETAETAIRASMTGHMVLSTLHCNDAPSAIPRLLDMGIDPFLLSTSLTGVMSQRLLRQLCPHCKVEADLNAEDRHILETANGSARLPKVYEGKGCPSCNHMGYKGRTAVHEVMPVTSHLGGLIASRQSIDVVRAEAAKIGYRTMQDEALDLVLQGRTSLAEARRVVFFEEHQAEDLEFAGLKLAS